MADSDPLDGVTKSEWFDLVRMVLAEHPDWTALTVKALNEGVLAAMDKVVQDSADVEQGLVELLQGFKGSPTPQKHWSENRREVVLKAVKGLRMTKGTPFQEKWLKVLEEAGEADEADD